MVSADEFSCSAAPPAAVAVPAAAVGSGLFFAFVETCCCSDTADVARDAEAAADDAPDCADAALAAAAEPELWFMLARFMRWKGKINRGCD